MENRLLRNEHDKVIAGVSSGIASYMEVDVTIIRLLFVLSTIFLVGTGVLVYLVMWIVVPVNNDPAAKFRKFNDYFKNQQNASGFTPPPFGQNPFQTGGPAQNSGQPGGQPQTGNPFQAETKTSTDWQNPLDYKGLRKNNDTGKTVGGLFLLVIGLYFLMNEFDIIPYWFRLGKLWPLVFVAIGLSFILKSKRKDSWKEFDNQPPAASESELPKENDFPKEETKEAPKDQF